MKTGLTIKEMAQELLRQLGMVDDLPPETIKKDTSDEY